MNNKKIANVIKNVLEIYKLNYLTKDSQGDIYTFGDPDDFKPIIDEILLKNYLEENEFLENKQSEYELDLSEFKVFQYDSLFIEYCIQDLKRNSNMYLNDGRINNNKTLLFNYYNDAISFLRSYYSIKENIKTK